jgi:hypothetical protein
LKIDQKLLREKVHISFLDYKDTVLFVAELNKRTLFLKSKKVLLDTITTSRKVSRELVVDSYKKSELNSGYGALKTSLWIVTKFFNFHAKYEKTPYLKNVIFYIGRIPKVKAGKFRGRFFQLIL